MDTKSELLKIHNTFGIPVNTARLLVTTSAEEMIKVWKETQNSQEPLLILGEGSNVLFTEDFKGTVMINGIKGIEIIEDVHSWLLHVGSGENWHDLVCFTLDRGMPGLENLALIPGLVGSAPVQNIGAFGVELESVCNYVDLLDFNTGDISRIPASECNFGYRDSIFKHRFRTGFVIVGVGLRLPKKWSPTLNYGNLAQLDLKTVTPHQVFDSVCSLRRSKIPDPRERGNAGSFFKNPIVNDVKCYELLGKYPDMPHFSQGSLVKLAAGWLIEQCGLKGYRKGGAAVHDKQALVLVNLDNAKGEDVVNLARHVRDTVAEYFGVMLEPQVRFIGATGEIDAVEVLSN